MLDLFGLSLQSKMLVRLYVLPTVLLLFSLLLLTLGETVQEIVKRSLYLSTLGDFVNKGMLWGSLLVLCGSGILFVYFTYRLWQWEKGVDIETCHTCGGMVRNMDGKYGAYYKCLACGSNRSMNR